MAAIKITLSKDVDTREELDNFVRTNFGEDHEKNREVTLEANSETLQKLNLSEDTTVFGVRITKNDVIEAPEAIIKAGKP
jgi:cupin superfamily acireductone dioxygenase involved in methionine salvage